MAEDHELYTSPHHGASRPEIVMAGVITSILANAILRNRLQSILAKTPNINKQNIEEIKASAKLPKALPVHAIKHIQNAYYSEPPLLGIPLPRQLKKRLTEEQRNAIKQMGYIGYDPKYNKAGILAHEAGHAAIHLNNKWYYPSRLNQSILRPVSSALSPISTSLAFGAGHVTHNPIVGGTIGLITSGLINMPTLINEAQATSHAKDYLKNSKHKNFTKKQNQKALNRAYGTYLIGSLLAPTLIGVLSGALSSK